MRIFIALDVPDPIKAVISEVVRPLRDVHPLKWTRPEGLHLTLVFLGELDPSRLPALRTTLDAVSSQHPPLRLWLSGAGTFGAEATPHVLYLGLDGALQTARLLQGALATAVDAPPEAHPWTPHLTLARAKSPKGAEAIAHACRALAKTRTGAFTVSEVTLFESPDHQTGRATAGTGTGSEPDHQTGHYLALHRAPLRG